MSELDDPRVLFAAERTLLAWNRTSLALIAFGFLVERAGLLTATVTQSATRPGAGLIFWLGIAFIALGVFAAIISSRQYHAVLQTLGPAELPRGYAPRWGLIVNGAVALLGTVLIAALYIDRS